MRFAIKSRNGENTDRENVLISKALTFITSAKTINLYKNGNLSTANLVHCYLATFFLAPRLLSQEKVSSDNIFRPIIFKLNFGEKIVKSIMTLTWGKFSCWFQNFPIFLFE